MARKILEQRVNGGSWLARGSEERFLHFASRLLRRSEGEEKASARSGRNDSALEELRSKAVWQRTTCLNILGATRVDPVVALRCEQKAHLD